MEDGSEVTPFYDPMIAKVIAHGETRERSARPAGRRTRPHHHRGAAQQRRLPRCALPRAETFRAGTFDTGFIEHNLAALGAIPQFDPAAAALGALRLIDRDLARIAALRGERTGLAMGCDRWLPACGCPRGRNTHLRRRRARDSDLDAREGGLAVSVDGERPGDGVLVENGEAVHVLRRGRQTVVARRALAHGDMEHGNGDGVVRAPMHGKVLAILVEPGATVTKGQRLAIIEAMKMEHTLTAPIAGTITEISVAVGNQVAERSTIMVVRPDNDHRR